MYVGMKVVLEGDKLQHGHYAIFHHALKPTHFHPFPHIQFTPPTAPIHHPPWWSIYWFLQLFARWTTMCIWKHTVLANVGKKLYYVAECTKKKVSQMMWAFLAMGMVCKWKINKMQLMDNFSFSCWNFIMKCIFVSIEWQNVEKYPRGSLLKMKMSHGQVRR